MNSRPRARVFVSCGQQKDTDELEIARRIADKLEKSGFEPYIAGEEQTLIGVKENIFRRLSESEYLIFIDLKRERLDIPGGELVHRGSLFSHQELAIAALLHIDILAFQEEGVKKEDGILKFIQANCVTFRDRHLLPDVVSARVGERQWDPNWRNELLLERDEGEFQDIAVSLDGRPARFFHIKVRNHHHQKIARDCVAYLERIENLSTGEVKSVELVEFKWKGVTTPRVAIPPNKPRYLDAFHIFHGSQNTVNLAINHTVVDFTGYYRDYTLIGPGTFELTYVVFSENFSPARSKFGLHIGNRLEDIQFYTKEQCADVT